jgi:peptidoglycan/LPS O-acetylase OafA/YrhL
MPADPTPKKTNNFDFVRVAAAFAVLYSHQFALSGHPEPIFLGGSWGGWGVLVFFAISGYLVAGSWERDPHLWRFGVRRFLRLWPGLAVSVLLLVLVLGPLVSSLEPRAYLSAAPTWNFLQVLTLASFESYLPGVFTGNPMPNSPNGSLWTIPIEVRCYVALALLGWLRVLRWRWLFSLAFAAFAVWFFFGWGTGYDHPMRMPMQMGVAFAMGAFLSAWRQVWLPRRRWGTPLAALGFSALWFSGLQELAATLGLATGAVLVGTASTPVLRRFGRFGDISYGFYIYAFPVQQTLIWLTGNQMSVWHGLWDATVVTVLLALLSWHYVEKPALRWKDRLVPRQPGAAPVPEHGAAARTIG